MTKPLFENIQACVFDAYGTLFDVHSAVERHRARIGAHAGQVSALWRTKQLEYTWLRSLMGRHADFWQVTGDALDYALDTYGIVDERLREELLAAYGRLSCYQEVKTVLATLRAHGLQCLILSNGSPAMLQSALAGSDLEDEFAAVLSVEEIGRYKPDPAVYQLALTHTGLAAPQISFQSSNAWDIAGAASFGFRTAWVNRFDQKRERLPFGADAELKDLAALPALLGIARG